jgi:acyl-CoA dehydrogenase
MLRTVYGEEHEAFRDMVRSFLLKEVVPVYPEWEQARRPSRDLFRRLGDLGVLGVQAPEQYGGGGIDSFKFNAIVGEEQHVNNVPLGGIRLQMDIVMPYLLAYCNEEQKARWLPGVISGELICAIGMTEPETGSDLASLRTTAKRVGDEYVVNGSKTMISNGISADLVVTAVKTDPDAGRDGISLLVIEGGTPGFERGRNLEKLGKHAEELGELFFNDVRVPAANLLGEEGKGWGYMTFNLSQERLSVAIGAQASAVAALATTIEYVKNRKAFGTPIASFQNTKFELAACATDIEAGQALVDAALEAHDAGTLTPADAAKVKLFCTELQGRVTDRCLQLHGGYGYMTEYPIAKMYADARVTRIYAGSSEIMKTIISKSIGL